MVHPEPESSLSAAALREWEGHVESVLRGVAHALNNRAAAVSGVVELWNVPGETSSNRALLEGEVHRIRDLVGAVRAIGSHGGQVESFEPTEAATAARVIIGLHADLRERSITIDSASAPPLRTAKWMLVRTLVALAAAAAVSGNRSGVATITIRGEAGWVVIRAAGVGLTPELTPYVLEMARAMGGEPLADVPGFRLPSLAELRRREGR
jgi:hypothetical protein